MPSCAGTGIVTTCTLTRVILSTTGTSRVRPGGLRSGWARPSRNTTPRSTCLTTRIVESHPTTATAASTSSTIHTTSTRTSAHQPGPLRENAGLTPGKAPFRSADLPLAALPVRRPQLALEDLAGGVAGQGVEDVHRVGALVVREVLPAEGDEPRLGRLLPRLQRHDGLDGLAPGRVGHADDGDLHDRRVLREHPLDLGRVHVLAAGDDHVLEPVLDEHEALVVDAAQVAGAEPAVRGDDRGGLLGPAQEPLHQLPGPQPDLPVPPRRPFLQSRRVDDADLAARDRLSRRQQPLGVV